METSAHPCPWPDAPQTLILGSHDIHVWCAALDLPPATVGRLRQTLSEDEGRRADRFRTGELRDRFIAGRGTLRAILSRYLGGEPGQLQLRLMRRLLRQIEHAALHGGVVVG